MARQKQSPATATPFPTPSTTPFATRAPSPSPSASHSDSDPPITTKTYFSNFHDFTPDPTASLTSNFTRLKLQRNWGPKKAGKLWKKCVTVEYTRLIGDKLGGLNDWVELCHELGLEGDFGSVTKCKKALKRVHVNIVDLLDARSTGSMAQKFSSVRKLKEYTYQTGRFVPKALIKEDKLLKVLLRPVA